MRIISKYNDFYDHFGYVYGEPDLSITYLRTPLFKDITQDIKDKLKKYIIHNSYVYSKNRRTGYIAILDTIIVGIYPYIYVCPFYIICKRGYSYTPVKEISPISVSERDVHNGNYESIYSKVNSVFSKYCNDNNIHEPLDICPVKPGLYSNSFQYVDNNWTIEMPEVFRTLKAPVFTYIGTIYREYNFLPYVYDGRVETYNKLYINPILTKFNFDILGTHSSDILGDINVYNRIEDFLFSEKTEPESTPDNNTKILNAGFDLKTSFRNVK